MKRSVLSRKNKEYWFVYSCCFVIVFIIIFIPFWIKGNSFIRKGDGFNQTYPALIYIGNYIRRFLNGIGLQEFDFNVGLGESVVVPLNALGFGDVFTLLSAFIKPQFTAYLFSVLVCLKLYFSGITFSFYCFHKGFKCKYVLIGSLLYVFNNFSLVGGLQYYQNLNPVIWLPLMLLGIDIILEGKKQNKFVIAFIFAVFIQALNGFYHLYMVTIFAGVYFLVSFFTSTNVVRGWKNFIAALLPVIVQYTIGIMMASFIFIPAIAGYFSSSRTERTFEGIGSLLFYSDTSYFEYFRNLLIPRAWESSAGLSLITILCIILVLKKTYKNKLYKSLTVFLLVAYFTPLTGFIMNGFSYSIDRWSYMLHFVLAVIVVDVLGQYEKKAICKSSLLILISVSFFSLFLKLVASFTFGTILSTITYFILLLLLVFWVYFHNAQKNRSFHIILFVLANIMINGLMINGPVILGGDGYSAEFEKLDGIYSRIEDSIANGLQDENGFYRVDSYDSSLGSSMVLGYNGTTQYFSIANENVYQFFDEFMISPGIRSASHILKGIDGRQVLESILSVRYYQVIKEGKSGNVYSELKKNSLNLPLGFTYETYICKEKFDKMTEIDRMDALLKGVVVEQEIPGMDEAGDTDGSCVEKVDFTVEYDSIEQSGNKLYVKPGSCINIYLKNFNENTGELYVKLNDLKLLTGYTADIDIEGKSIQVRNSSDSYYLGRDDFLVQMKISTENKIKLVFQKGGVFSLGSLQIFWYPMKDLSTYIEKLSEEYLKGLSIHMNTIKGQISLSKPKVLFMSIPYSQGWNAFVDGKKVPIYKANIGFMAIPLGEGKHAIELVYHTPGGMTGKIMTICGFALFFSLLISNKRRRC